MASHISHALHCWENTIQKKGHIFCLNPNHLFPAFIIIIYQNVCNCELSYFLFLGFFFFFAKFRYKENIWFSLVIIPPPFQL